MMALASAEQAVGKTKKATMSSKNQECVWLQVDDSDLWVLAHVTDRSGGKVTLQRRHAPKGVKTAVTLSDEEFLKFAKAQGGDHLDDGVDDLVTLEDVTDASMLHTLRMRYEEDNIYTAIGPVCIAMNPYKPVGCCMADYFSRLSQMPIERMPPHIARLARQAYGGMHIG